MDIAECRSCIGKISSGGFRETMRRLGTRGPQGDHGTSVHTSTDNRL